MRLSLMTVICALSLGAGSAHAQFLPGGPAPGACAGDFWTDLVGSDTIDLVVGNRAPERIYGLSEADLLVGSDTRASCLFGGTGSDSLYLGRGGGVILGEEGRDLLVGSPKSDALAGGDGSDALFGGDGGDVLRGDGSTDSIDAGPGDDAIVSDDGNPELIACGPGSDTVYADRADVLFGCENWRLVGPPLEQRRLNREYGKRRTRFKARFTSPENAPRGRFQVLAAAPGCGGSALTVARSKPLRRGQHTKLRIRPPKAGWCRGGYVGAIVRKPDCPAGGRCPIEPPAEPLAWLSFVIRR